MLIKIEVLVDANTKDSAALVKHLVKGMSAAGSFSYENDTDEGKHLGEFYVQGHLYSVFTE